MGDDLYKLNCTGLYNDTPGCYTFFRSRQLHLTLELELVKEGQIGELYVSGPCVSPGYLGMDAESNERFFLAKINGIAK